MQEFENKVLVSKPSVGARIGYFFLSLTPVAACVALQFICVLVVMIGALMLEIIKNPIDYTDVAAVEAMYMEVVMGSAPAGVLSYHVVGTLVFGIWYYFSFRRPRPSLLGSIRKLNLKNLIITVVCGVGLCFFANGTVCIEAVLMPGLVEDYVEMAQTAGLGTNVLAIIASVILAPIGEEFVCRGLAQKYAKKCFGKFWIANLLQAFLFGLIHMNWVQGIYAFAIGLVLGWLVERYDTILPAILLHCVVNFSSTVWVGYVLAPVPMNLVSGLILIIASSGLIGAMLLWGGKKKS